MSMKLKLTGMQTFTSPRTYGVAMTLGQVALFRDDDGQSLIDVTTPHPTTGVPINVFTDVTSNPSESPSYDFTDNVNQAPIYIDRSVSILPEHLEYQQPPIPAGVILRDAYGHIYGFSDGQGYYVPLRSPADDDRRSNLLRNDPRQIFTTPGSGLVVNVPHGVRGAWVALCQGGAGGGSGRRGAAATARSGGGGGAGGIVSVFYMPVEDMGGPLTVDIGAGGAGGAAVTTNDTNGNPGVIGGATTLRVNGSIYHDVRGGGTFNGGTNAVTSGGYAGQIVNVSSSTAPSTNVTGNAPDQHPNGFVYPGSPGGSISTADVVLGFGKTGNIQGNWLSAPTTSGANGVGVRRGNYFSSMGGNGGAASITAAATKGGDGIYGSGGGGGGASLNGFNSGAGGKGGDGWAIFLWD